MSFLNMFGGHKSPEQPKEENKNFDDLSTEELKNMLSASPEERFGKYIKFFPGIEPDMILHYKDNDQLIIDDINKKLEEKKELEMAA